MPAVKSAKILKSVVPTSVASVSKVPCVVPRAVPIVEAMASIVILNLLLQQNHRKLSENSYI